MSFQLTHNVFSFQAFLNSLDGWQQVTCLQKEDHKQSQLIAFELDLRNLHPDSNEVEELQSSGLDVEQVIHQLRIDNSQAVGKCEFT